MSEFIEIQWTSGSIDEARKICRYLVQERLVAGAQIIPWIESIFNLDNQLDTAQESKVVLRTVLERFDKIKKVIQENCTYEIPEIIFRKIDGGNEEYLQWIKENSPGAPEGRTEYTTIVKP